MSIAVAEVSVAQDARDSALAYAARIVGAVAAADARARGGLDWEEIADEALRMAVRFESYIREGDAAADADEGLAPEEAAVVRAATAWVEAKRGWLLDDPERRADPEDLALVEAVGAVGEAS